jgi:hypothetical protein
MESSIVGAEIIQPPNLKILYYLILYRKL